MITRGLIGPKSSFLVCINVQEIVVPQARASLLRRIRPATSATCGFPAIGAPSADVRVGRPRDFATIKRTCLNPCR